MTYAYISVKELTVDVLPALTIKPAMLFGLKWDISTWLNQNILVKGAPLHVFNNDAPGGEKEPEPDLDPIEQHTFRTERCNTCVGVFDKVIHGSASTKYCDKTTHAFELCAQVSTMVKTFLQSNGSPGFWRHWFSGINRATHLSFQQVFGLKGTMKEVTQRFTDKCSKWPSEFGRRDCLAEEFCLYSAVACHAKLATESEEVKEVEGIFRLENNEEMES